MSDPISPYIAARARGVLVVLFLTVAGLLGYAVHQHSVVSQLSADNTQMVSLLKDTRAQMSALASKLDAMNAPQPTVQLEKPTASVKAARPHRTLIAKRHAAGDPRFKRIQSQLDEHGKAIESTRQELASTRTELQGSIARTHQELVALQKKGERNYYEFDIDKSKQFQRTGPVGISVRKVSTKDMYADLKLMVNDAQLSKKHVNLFEPVVFYSSEEGRPVELVINSIRKNHIHGYISAPKYSSSELATIASAPAGDNAANAAPAAPDTAKTQRRKLEMPR